MADEQKQPDFLEKFQALPKDKQTELVKKMSPEQKQKMKGLVLASQAKKPSPPPIAGPVPGASGGAPSVPKPENPILNQPKKTVHFPSMIAGVSGAKVDLPPEEADKLQKYMAKDASINVALGMAAEAAPVLKAAIPTTGRAGAAFEKLREVAGTWRIGWTKPGNIALEASDFAEKGNFLPAVLRRFVQRVTGPGKTEMTYDEARDFYSTASRLTADQQAKIAPKMRMYLARFTQALGQEIETAAQKAGKLQEYKSAMRDYHIASGLEEAATSIRDAAVKKIIPWSVYAYVAGKLAKSMIGGGGSGSLAGQP
jgi:hypothetical protein